ncbi:MAG: TonB-dependent receptor [Crocinitomicaceae bacterium]|nr:TonB-dependent receptor [Crocinitomicaceae bacterium]
MKNLFLLFLLCGICHFLHSQVVTIKDRETGLPLELVVLSSDHPKAFSISNSQGQADISVFGNAEKIDFRLIGYKSESYSFVQLEHTGLAVSLAPNFLSLDQLVVSASRWNQSRMEVPEKITTISAADVQLQNPQTAADLIGLSGEAAIQKSQQGGGSPMIRGFATNRLLISVDGIRMNTAIFRSGNIQNVISLDPLAIENTELLFGPGSLIYGSDAIGGTMNFQTLSPQIAYTGNTIITGKAITRYSTANSEKTIHFDINAGWRKWALMTSISHNDFGDLRMGSKGPDEYLRTFYVQRIDSTDMIISNSDPLIQRYSGYSQINAMQKIRFSPSSKWDIVYALHYSTTSDYPRYDRQLRLRSNGLPRSAEWYYGPQEWMMSNLVITQTSNNKIYDIATLRLAQQFFGESRIDRDFNDPEKRSRVEKVYALSANLDFNRSINEHQKFFYGLEVVTNKVHSSGMDENIITHTVSPGPARYPQARWSSSAAYIIWQQKVSKKINTQTGIRYNRFMLDAQFDTTFYPFPYTTARFNKGALTGSIGLIITPYDDFSICLNGSTGFRSPNVDDLGKVFDSEPGSVVVPNPSVNAEYVWNGEFNLAKIFDNNVKVELTGFYSVLNNALVRRDFTLNGQDSIVYDGEMSKVQAIQNAASATVFGAVVNIEIKLTDGFGIRSKYNFQHGTEELDDRATSPLRHAAPPFGVSHLTYSTNKLTLDFYAAYSRGKNYNELPQEEQEKIYMYALDETNRPYSPAWFTLNFKSMYRLSENFSISAGLENILDKRYRTYSSGIVAPGRNMVLSLRADF